MGDYAMVNKHHKHLWTDSAGTISSTVQVETDHLLMEAALSSGQYLSNIVTRWKGISWTNRGGMDALCLEALLGSNNSIFGDCLLPHVSSSNQIERIMTPFEEARALQATLELKNVALCFFKDSVVPIIDDWGRSVGFLHRKDCKEVSLQLNAPLSAMMKSPPPFVATSTSVGRVNDNNRYKMVVIVRQGMSNGSSLSAVGVFTSERMHDLVVPESDMIGQNCPNERCKIT
ncbi:LOW QUALITY PROTEIN: hypothetical protein RJ641_022033 [Dillenia turbinata]|uniref:CBS domain-containing protein n=1 Tax=Dillenia turbinata TaxID=194707 RepID=A0AAN8ULL8_9MAGN